jgi:hypothetical protein
MAWQIGNTWGCWGRKMRETLTFLETVTEPPSLCVRKELGCWRQRGRFDKLISFSSMSLVRWEMKAKQENGERGG